MRSGTTRASSTLLASAPASKISHETCWFARVTQTIPKFVSSSALAIASPHRAPLPISSSDIHGSTC